MLINIYFQVKFEIFSSNRFETFMNTFSKNWYFCKKWEYLFSCRRIEYIDRYFLEILKNLFEIKFFKWSLKFIIFNKQLLHVFYIIISCLIF